VKRILILALVFCTVTAGFMIPANAQMVKVEKKESGSSKKGWLGVSIQDITSEMKKAMDLNSREGALVSEVVRKSPADSAGLMEKDIIVQFDGQTISDASELQKAVADTKPGTKVKVVVMRKGDKKTIDVVVGSQKTSRSMVFTSPRGFSVSPFFGGAQNTQGMSLRQLNDQLAKYFDVPEGTGVLVWEVEKGSAAEKAGISAGDVISVIGKKKIKELRDVSRALGIYDEGEKAEIEIVRKGARKTVSLEVAEGNDGEGYQYWFNDAPFKKRSESMLFNVPNIDPNFDFESVHPDLDHLKIEMNDLREHLKDRSMQLRENSEQLRDQAKELREKIEMEIMPRVRARISHSI
jgi:membrane-associated protease RseP (regulator of RpoE activity)